MAPEGWCQISLPRPPCSLGDLANVGVDLASCCGSLEWSATREACEELLPQLLPWERCCTAQESAAYFLACGSVRSDLRAGQNELGGPFA